MTNLSQPRLLVKVAVVFALVSALTAWKTYPLILHFGTHWIGGRGDELLNTWILAWNVHALMTDPWNLFHANILYPAENSLAFSEHMLGVLPLFAPAYIASSNPILAYNIVFFLSFPLSAATMFVLVHAWTRNLWAALLAGCLFAFAPIRLWQLGHLQLLNLYWAPLALLWLEQFLHNGRWRDLAGFALCYWWQVLCSVYLGWFTTIALAIYIVYYGLFVDLRYMSRSMLVKWLSFGAFSVLVLLPIHLPYYTVQRQWGVARTVQECIFYSADAVLSYLNVPTIMTDVYRPLLRFASEPSVPAENWLFPGFVIVGLLVFAGCPPRGWLPRPDADRLKQLQRRYWVILLASFILSLGPYLIVIGHNTQIPLPYLLLYEFVPGFSAMRVPSRYAFMVSLAASVLAAVGLLRLNALLQASPVGSRLGTVASQGGLALACLTLFSLELGFKPLPLARIETGHEVPEVYRWLAAEKPGPIIEFPIGLPENAPYMYFSIYHWQPLVNGHTGFIPPTYDQIMSELQDFPARRGVQFLSALGVRGVLVHHDRLSPDEVSRWQRADPAAIGLQQRAQFGADVVYVPPAVDWTEELQLALRLPARLPAGAALRFALLAQGRAQRPWRHPRPVGRTEAVVEWVEQQTGSVTLQKPKLVLPVAIRGGEATSIGLPVRTPAVPGAYQVRLHVPRFQVAAESTVVEVTTEAVPTSVNAPQALVAAYTVREAPAEARVGRPVGVTLHVVNRGSALWLAAAEGDKGAVGLGWRWYRQAYHIPAWSGRARLQYDVPPGHAYEFRVQIPTPMEVGEYTLELDMVSELVTWFADQGRESVKFPVRLVNP